MIKVKKFSRANIQTPSINEPVNEPVSDNVEEEHQDEMPEPVINYEMFINPTMV